MSAKSQIDNLHCEEKVIPISLPYIYNLSVALHPLSSLEEEKSVNEHLFILLTAESELNSFLTQSVYSSALKASRAPGLALLGQLRALTGEEDKSRILTWVDFFYIKQALREFETVLTAEMNVGSAFWVSKKRGFDTSDLLNQAEILFPPELVQKVPEALADVRDFGRCLAFELGTAAGFHLVRATELVLRQFYDSVTHGAAKPGTTNIGDFLRALEEKNAGEKKTIAILRQFKDMHRNELIHPEQRLTLDDAIGLLGIAQSAIVGMLKEIPEPSSVNDGETLELLAPKSDIELL